MREIKFRGLTFSNEWVFGSLDLSEEKPKIRVHDKRLSYSAKYVRPETVGQFTGLHDKYNKPIFEGDILEFTNILKETYVCEVKWDGLNPCFMMERYDRGYSTDCEYDFVQCGASSARVIGNIYENKELIEHLEPEEK